MAQEFSSRISEILINCDLDKTTSKGIRKQLEKESNTSLLHIKNDIDKLVLELLNKQISVCAATTPGTATTSVAPPTKTLKSRGQQLEDQLEKDHQLALSLATSKRSPRATVAASSASSLKKSVKKTKLKIAQADKKEPRETAFTKLMLLSPALVTFIGAPTMSRTQVVKSIWNHVKANNLQDPSDRRFIVCDGKLSPIFGKRVHMFTLNKILADHLFKIDDVVGSKMHVAASRDDLVHTSDEDDEHDKKTALDAPKKAKRLRKNETESSIKQERHEDGDEFEQSAYAVAEEKSGKRRRKTSSSSIKLEPSVKKEVSSPLKEDHSSHISYHEKS